MGVSLGLAAEWFFGGAVAEAVVGGGAAALAATEVMAPIVVSAGSLAASGLTVAEAAALGIGVAGTAGAAGAFDSAGNYVDPGYPGDGQPYDANGMPYGNTSSYEFGMPISDQQVAAMTQQQGASLGLQDAGWTWKDGVGWAKNALGLANAAAGMYGTIQNGKYKVNAANAAANSSKLSAEDAARRATQIETYGLDAAKTMQPWDENGGRKLAGEQLQELLKNPMGVASNDPAYKMRQQAAQRAMGIYGQDSGAMGIAAADASSTWYDQRLQQLSGLAGANAAPGAGGSLGVSTLNSAANIAGMGQASGAFGQQAALAAGNAQTTGNLNTLGALGNVVNTVGGVLNGSGDGTNISFGSGSPIPGDTTYTPPGTTSVNKGPVVGSTGGPLPVPVDTGGGDVVSPGATAGTTGFKAPAVGSTGMQYSDPAATTGGPAVAPVPIQQAHLPQMGGYISAIYGNGPADQTIGPMPVSPQAQLSAAGGALDAGGSGFASANPPGFDQMNPAPPQAAMSALGGYFPASSGSRGLSPMLDSAQVPDLWQSQMGDLLGNYLGSVQRMGA